MSAEKLVGIRRIKPRVQDYWGPIAVGSGIMPEQIAEKTVQKFCGGCDMLGSDGVCKVAGANDQARYAARRWCGWASVNHVRGSMTDKGFQGPTQPTKSEISEPL